MKRIFTAGTSIVLVLILSCSKSHNVQNSVNILVANEVIGSWKITSYTDSGVDKTTAFDFISIQFNSNLTMMVFNNDTTVDGTWAIKPQDGLDKLNIVLMSSSIPYSIFDADWYVMKTTEGALNLTYGISPALKKISLQRL